MLLFDTALAPNPKRVRMFLAEKGVVVETRQVDLIGLEHKSEAYRRINPMASVPRSGPRRWRGADRIRRHLSLHR